MKRLIVAITGATGAIYGVRLLEMLRDTAVETHLVISPWGRRTLLHETTYTVDQVQRLAYGHLRAERSGRRHFERIVPHDGHGHRSLQHAHAGGGRARAWRQSRSIAPPTSCSRSAASCCLRLARRPLSDIHLENMLKLSRMGVVICPPVPGFYQRPESIDDIVNHSVVRMLDQFGIHVDGPGRWGEEFALGLAGKTPLDDSENY